MAVLLSAHYTVATRQLATVGGAPRSRHGRPRQPARPSVQPDVVAALPSDGSV